MKAEELMIGDWVQVPSEMNRYKRICSTFDMDSAVLYRPIPLTPDILEKNGFVPSDEWKSLYYLNDGEDEFAFEINNSYQIWWSKECGNVLIAQLKYVHTLQHVLRLCGIDKEIVL